MTAQPRLLVRRLVWNYTDPYCKPTLVKYSKQLKYKIKPVFIEAHGLQYNNAFFIYQNLFREKKYGQIYDFEKQRFSFLSIFILFTIIFKENQHHSTL